MDFWTRRDRALAIVREKGIANSMCAPGLFRVLWALGAKVPPPHFMRFPALALLHGVWFATVWGLCMWFFASWRRGAGIGEFAGPALALGVFYGVFMAAYYRRGKSKYHLPTWDSLGTP
jgi:hypothetical protein